MFQKSHGQEPGLVWKPLKRCVGGTVTFRRQTGTGESLVPFLLPPSKAYRATATPSFSTATQPTTQLPPETRERKCRSAGGHGPHSGSDPHFPIAGQEHLCFVLFSPNTFLTRAGAFPVAAVRGSKFPMVLASSQVQKDGLFNSVLNV